MTSGGQQGVTAVSSSGMPCRPAGLAACSVRPCSHPDACDSRCAGGRRTRRAAICVGIRAARGLLMGRVTGEPPRMWGKSIIGFGEYHYEYKSGREGDAPAASFSPRKAATTIYLPDGI